jgi:hypothetical protein
MPHQQMNALEFMYLSILWKTTTDSGNEKSMVMTDLFDRVYQ